MSLLLFNEKSYHISWYCDCSDGKGDIFAGEMRAKLKKLDQERAALLMHPKEGVLFLTHEIDAVCLEHFDLIEFPYDTQVLF